MITAKLADQDSVTTLSYTLMEMPIVTDYGDKFEKQVALDGSLYVDYAYTKRKFELKFGFLSNAERQSLRNLIIAEHWNARRPIVFELIDSETPLVPLASAQVFVEMGDWNLASKCLRADDVELTMTEF